MKRLLPLLMLLATLIAARDALANPYETTLANGLRVIVKEDRRAPTAVQMVWYRAGSMDEKDGSSGLAHVLEHLMFKGTQKVKSGEFSQRVAAAGGRDNAFTSRDYTAYFQQVPVRALPEMMMLEADRMANLRIPRKGYDQEIKVVMEERRWRTEDDPVSLVHEALNSMAFQAHPYRRPVIGWMDDLLNMTQSDTEQWYRSWYAPNNAWLVIAGDVRHEEVFRLAAKYYGGIKPQVMPERKPQNEPAQKGIRRVVVKAPAKLPYIAMAWKVPKLLDVNKDREPYALAVLSAVLDGGAASRFSKNLVRGQKIAQSAGAGYDSTARGESLFVVDGQSAEGHAIGELEAALRGEIKRIQEEGVSPEELARIKTQTIAGQVFKRDSVMGQAMEIGATVVIGMDWRDIDKMLDRIRSVTADEVQAVAKKYFGDDTLTIATLDPQPIDPDAEAKKPAVHH
jgi:zinc protease